MRVGASVKVRICLALVAAAALVMPAQALAVETAADADFPAGYEGYHTYAEVGAALDAAVASYGAGKGAILSRRVIGQSYEGRDIWAVKISDRVARDEAEPEVLAECGMHAREHITVEMCLYMIELLTENYGQASALGQQITRLVNTREIWIIPTVNPDGAEYDHLDGVWRGWRKNRQPIPGSTKVGIDLNRNWDYLWGCCGGSSTNPGSGQYRGQYPFQAVENRVLRDFILGRRVGGVQQIKTIFNWHSTGEFVMWPYGFTKEDVPAQMTTDDHAAFVTIGEQMAALNGYKPRQGSDSYIYDGDFPAWAYGDQRIFIYTIEMYPSFSCGACGGFHPPDSVLGAQLARNRETVLYFLEQADCVYRAAGLGGTHCGPINDDFETGRGWKLKLGAGSGWQRGTPAASSTAAGTKQLASVPSGMAALVTGLAAGVNPNANDVDGRTVARTQWFRLGSGRWQVDFSYVFAHDATSSPSDYLRLSIVKGTSKTVVWYQEGAPSERNAVWQSQSVNLDAFAGKRIKLLFEAVDGGGDSLVEAALDNVRVHPAP